MLLSHGAVPARPRRRGPRRRARVRGADLAVELREQVGIGLAVQLAPVYELPRAWEAEERGNVEVDEPAWTDCVILELKFDSAPRSTLIFRREARYFLRPSPRRRSP